MAARVGQALTKIADDGVCFDTLRVRVDVGAERVIESVEETGSGS